MKLKQHLNIKIDKEVHKKLKVVAAMEGKTMQDVAEKVISDYVNRRFKKGIESEKEV